MQQMLVSFGGSTNISTRILEAGLENLGEITTRETITGPVGTQGYLSNSYGTLTLPSTKNYVSLFRATADASTTTDDVIVACYDDIGDKLRFNVEPQDTTDRFSFGGIYAFTGDNTNNVIGIKAGSETAGVTVGWQGVEAAVLQLERDDKFVHSAGATATTTNYVTSYTTKCTVTVDKAGFYLIIGTASMNMSATGTISRARLIYNQTNDIEIAAYGAMHRKDTTNYIPVNLSGTVQLLANTVVSLQFGSNGTDTTTMREASLVAIYIGTSTSTPTEMLNYYYVQDQNLTTTSSTSFVNKVSSAFNIANPSNSHLLIATCTLTGGDTSNSAFAQLFNTTTSVNYNTIDWVFEAHTATGSPYICIFYVGVISFTQASNTIAWRYRIENSATVAGMGAAHIALIDLGTTYLG